MVFEVAVRAVTRLRGRAVGLQSVVELGRVSNVIRAFTDLQAKQLIGVAMRYSRHVIGAQRSRCKEFDGALARFVWVVDREHDIVDADGIDCRA